MWLLCAFFSNAANAADAPLLKKTYPTRAIAIDLSVYGTEAVRVPLDPGGSRGVEISYRDGANPDLPYRVDFWATDAAGTHIDLIVDAFFRLADGTERKLREGAIVICGEPFPIVVGARHPLFEVTVHCK